MLGILVREQDLENNRYVSDRLVKRKRRRIDFTRPDGSKGHANHAFLLDGKWLNEFSLEYLALEFTRDCNVSCAHCYVTADKINGKEPNYINLDFIVELAHNISDSPSAGQREICITGGEPTLDIKKLQTRYSVLNEIVPGKTIAIASNLLAVPCSEQGIGDFFSIFSDAIIQSSYSPYLEKQYELIAANLDKEKNSKFIGTIPTNVSPGYSLLEKIRMFDDYAYRQGKNFIIRVNGVSKEDMDTFQNKASSYLGSKGRATSDFIYSSRVIRVGNGRKLAGAIDANSAARECSQKEEIYICFNGDLYPTVNHIDNVKNRIGTLVMLK